MREKNSPLPMIAAVGGAVVVLVLVIAAGFFLLRDPAQRFDPQEYVTLEDTGYDGSGVVEVTYRESAMKSELAPIVQKKAKKIGFQTEDGKISYEDMIWQQSADTADEELDVCVRYLEDLIEVRIANNKDLKNGDSLQVSYVCDNDTLKKYGLQAAQSNGVHAVQALMDHTQIDPFLELAVSYSGISPMVSVNAIPDRRENGVTIAYTAEPETGLKLGQTVVVTANVVSDSPDVSLVKAQKEYRVEDVDSYTTSIQGIGNEALSQMKKTAESVFELGRVKEWPANASLQGLHYCGMYFLRAKETGKADHQNLAYLVYQVDMDLKNGDKTETKSYYFYTTFYDLINTKDQSCRVDLTEYTYPATIAADKEEVCFFETDGMKVAGYESLNAMYAACVSSRSGQYLCDANTPKPYSDNGSREAAEESSRKAEEESSKAAAEESSKVAAEESRKAAEESSKAAAEESRKAAEESSKAAAEESRKAAEESSKAAAEESRKAEEESSKAAAEESRKAEEESSKAAAEESRKAEEESSRAAAEESRKAAEESSRAADESIRAAEESIWAAEESMKAAEESRKAAEESSRAAAEESRKAAEESSKAAAEEESRRAAEEESRKAAEEESRRAAEESSSEELPEDPEFETDAVETASAQETTESAEADSPAVPSGEASTWKDQTPMAYEASIRAYRQLLNSGKAPVNPQEDLGTSGDGILASFGISFDQDGFLDENGERMTTEDLSALGLCYTLQDLNGDQIPEMIVGTSDAMTAGTVETPLQIWTLGIPQMMEPTLAAVPAGSESDTSEPEEDDIEEWADGEEASETEAEIPDAEEDEGEKLSVPDTVLNEEDAWDSEGSEESDDPWAVSDPWVTASVQALQDWVKENPDAAQLPAEVKHFEMYCADEGTKVSLLEDGTIAAESVNGEISTYRLNADGSWMFAGQRTADETWEADLASAGKISEWDWTLMAE